jgi:L-alanine-DL-glutamate epimerase-like enolase superfamily enzyme
MRITAVDALYLRLPEIQARTDSSQDALLIRIETDAGITGWGEVDGCPWVVKAIVEAPMSHTPWSPACASCFSARIRSRPGASGARCTSARFTMGARAR